MESNSSEESSVSDYSTESSDEDGMETAQINGTRLLLPQGLCDREDVFRDFFSPNLWNSLSDEHKTHLQTFLPKFPSNDEEEKTVTLQRLFNFETFKFSNPLQDFHHHLKAGYFRPDIARMRNLIRRAERKEAKHRYRNHKESIRNEVLDSRKKLLIQIRNLPPGIEPKVDKVNVTDIELIRHRTKRRYFQILSSISSEQKFSSTFTGKSSTLDLERYITPSLNPFYINDEAYRNILRNHKKRKQEEPDDPEFSTRNISLTDVIHRTQLPYLKIVQVQHSKSSANDNRTSSKKKLKKDTNYHYSVPNVPLTPTHPTSNSENESDSDSLIDAVTVPPVKHRKTENKVVKITKIQPVKPVKVEVKEEPEEVTHVPVSQETVTVTSSNSNIISPINSYSQYGKIMPVTLSDLEGIDMMNLPIDLDNSDIDILEVNNKPELMQETHSNFLSLIRDIICSTNEHRMDFPTLEKRLQTWQESPISPLNDWYSLSDSWVGVLQSAINFLCGNTSELPNDFVPYLEYKQPIDVYQWIGAGRDSDNLLVTLCKFWLEHRDELKTVKLKEEADIELSDRAQTPPPPSDSWVGVLQSAINFLCGNTSELPNDFVPYLEYKQPIDVYQWIGAGRDSDNLLVTLCKFWLEHRDELKTVKLKEEADIELSDRAQTPPPPRCPTNWTVRKGTPEEIEKFQEQEKKRYENPHRAFTYCCNGYESVVAPLKGIYNPAVGSAKARGHTILTADRPNFVTILSLVRDATARLPNGEGTRGDIVELLKHSQYISPTATDNVLQTVVSGALDRMHTQFDPCVKYDTKRKIWIYLHRNRSEEDFEKIHQHLQGVPKVPKKATKNLRLNQKLNRQRIKRNQTKKRTLHQKILQTNLKQRRNLIQPT
ncbi:hypothetical protein HHI36_009808 [Cryptolaemus montrouzieri]|uniref:DEUBAD domain-containing protein n=1 Tax=Cryptolaemus montrouzieri TaxID=559131 RepID=A0ABD2MGY9_9CUCU